MIPIRDNIPSRSLPFVTYAILGINIVVFAVQLAAGNRGDEIVQRYGMVPVRITEPAREIVVPVERAVRTPFGIVRQVVEQPLPPAPVHPYVTLLTCIVLHGGWMHLIGNCWFLYIFGDNVEDRLGHGVYALFYALSGVGASLTQWATAPYSPVPTIGASGAIAGVMGAYFLLYPNARVLTVVPILVIIEIVVVPAYLFLGVWVVFQFIQSGATRGSGAGVAWWAHIGGFLIGAGIILLLKYGRLLRTAPSWEGPARRVSVYRYRRL